MSRFVSHKECAVKRELSGSPAKHRQPATSKGGNDGRCPPLGSASVPSPMGSPQKVIVNVTGRLPWRRGGHDVIAHCHSGL